MLQYGHKATFSDQKKNTVFQSQNTPVNILADFRISKHKEGIELNFESLDLLSAPLQTP